MTIGRPFVGFGKGKEHDPKFCKVDKAKARRLRKKGMTLVQIGQVFGVSYQAIQCLLKRPTEGDK